MPHDVAGVPGLDPTLPDVKLKLGGVERQLCYDFNAIALVEAQTGLQLLFQELRDQRSALNLRALLWSALLRDEPEITLAEVGALINPRNIGVIHSALIAAWYGSAVTDDKGDDTAGEAQGQPAAAD